MNSLLLYSCWLLPHLALCLVAAVLRAPGAAQSPPRLVAEHQVQAGPGGVQQHLHLLHQHSTVQYSTVQYSTVQHSTVQYSTVQYSTAHHHLVTVALQLHPPVMRVTPPAEIRAVN